MAPSWWRPSVIDTFTGSFSFPGSRPPIWPNSAGKSLSPARRATWAYVEATHSPDIEGVATTVITTLRRVFTCVDSDLLVLKLSSLTERGATAASERPLAQPLPEPRDYRDQPWPSAASQPGSSLVPARRTEPWAPYYEVLYPEPTRPTSAFGRWKRATTGVNITQTYWEARERERVRWGSIPHTTGEWELQHPPVVLWMPECAEAACLGCKWLGGGGTIDQAAELARQHSVDGGDDPSVILRLAVPISARNGPTDQPLSRSCVSPQPAGPLDVEELLQLAHAGSDKTQAGSGRVSPAPLYCSILRMPIPTDPRPRSFSMSRSRRMAMASFGGSPFPKRKPDLAKVTSAVVEPSAWSRPKSTAGRPSLICSGRGLQRGGNHRVHRRRSIMSKKPGGRLRKQALGSPLGPKASDPRSFGKTVWHLARWLTLWALVGLITAAIGAHQVGGPNFTTVPAYPAIYPAAHDALIVVGVVLGYCRVLVPRWCGLLPPGRPGGS